MEWVLSALIALYAIAGYGFAAVAYCKGDKWYSSAFIVLAWPFAVMYGAAADLIEYIKEAPYRRTMKQHRKMMRELMAKGDEE